MVFWASASSKGASFHYRETRGLIQILHRIFKRLLSYFSPRKHVLFESKNQLWHFSAAPSPTVAVASGNLSRDLYFTFSSLLFFFQPSPRLFLLCASLILSNLYLFTPSIVFVQKSWRWWQFRWGHFFSLLPLLTKTRGPSCAGPLLFVHL